MSRENEFPQVDHNTLTLTPKSAIMELGRESPESAKRSTEMDTRTIIRHTDTLMAKARECRVTQIMETAYRVISPSGSAYVVAVNVARTGAICNCEWGAYRKAEDIRSVCSHTLAVFMDLARDAGRSVSAWSRDVDSARQHRPTVQVGDGVRLTLRKLGT